MSRTRIDPLPEWTLYKNDQPLGQAKTWHHGLDIIVRVERLSDVTVEIYSGYVRVTDIHTKQAYKITRSN